MKQTFLDIVKELGPNIALSELVYRFVFVWTEDYECERYLICLLYTSPSPRD